MNNPVLQISKNHGTDIINHYLLFGQLPPVSYHAKHRVYAALFLQLNTPSTLYRVLNRDFKTLQRLINQASYLEYTIPKKRGGKRLIEVPEPTLLSIQKELNFYLQCYYVSLRPGSVHGFIKKPNKHFKNRCIISNAACHTNKTAVLNIDLKDFFQNINSKQIYQLFQSPLFNFSENMASAYTLLCTHKDHLPTGAATSPILSNFICLQLDKTLEQFSLLNELTYTRYADDLTFSSQQHIDTNTILDLINIIQNQGFKINNKKVRITDKRGRQLVTGLVVNEKVNVDRRYIRNLRAMIHDIKLNGIALSATKHFKIPHIASREEQLKFLHRLKARIEFVGNVRGNKDSIYLRLSDDLSSALRT